MDRRVFAASLIILLVAAPAVSTLGSGSPSYEIEDLGATSDGLVPTVTGINASGQVSGYVNTRGLRAVRYTNGPGGPTCPALTVCSAPQPPSTSTVISPVITWRRPACARSATSTGSASRRSRLLPDFTSARGMAIADNGEVVGPRLPYGAVSHARGAPVLATGTLPVSWRLLSATVLHGLWSQRRRTGGRGVHDGEGFQHAYRLETNGSLTDIGTLAERRARLAASTRRLVGGQSKVGTDAHAFVFTGRRALRRAHSSSRRSADRGDDQRRRGWVI